MDELAQVEPLADAQRKPVFLDAFRWLRPSLGASLTQWEVVTPIGRVSARSWSCHPRRTLHMGCDLWGYELHRKIAGFKETASTTTLRSDEFNQDPSRLPERSRDVRESGREAAEAFPSQQVLVFGSGETKKG